MCFGGGSFTGPAVKEGLEPLGAGLDPGWRGDGFKADCAAAVDGFVGGLGGGVDNGELCC